MSTPAQNLPHPSLEIHHVFVGHGDATVIVIKNNNRIVHKTLIDASTLNGGIYLCNYFVKFMGDSNFDLVIPSHYHDDHLCGLLELGRGMHMTELMDIGGYDLTHKSFPSLSNAEKSNVEKLNPAPPKTSALPYIPDLEKIGMFRSYLESLRFIARVALPTPKRRVSVIGEKIVLGNISGVDVTLTTVAGNGYVHGTNERRAKSSRASDSPNNYSLAFILEYGQFRYFTGGDLGGGGSYCDHETMLATNLPKLYPALQGHVCAMKANHHGSDASNNKAFLDTLRPTVCITSVGTHKSHRLPGGNFLDRLNRSSSPSKGRRGIFFTQLADYEDAPRLTQADSLFGRRPDIAYGRGTQKIGASWVIKVYPPEQTTPNSVNFSVSTADTVVENQSPFREVGILNWFEGFQCQH